MSAHYEQPEPCWVESRGEQYAVSVLRAQRGQDKGRQVIDALVLVVGPTLESQRFPVTFVRSGSSWAVLEREGLRFIGKTAVHNLLVRAAEELCR